MGKQRWGDAVLEIAQANPDVVIHGDIPEQKGGKRNKYGAQRCEVDGIKFDSRKEMMRYFDLVIWERTGCISALELQPEFSLPGGVKYRADFMYNENGRVVVEDVKSEATAKNSTFRVKWRQVQELYPDIEWRIT